jgi:hypothetical protein
MRTSAKSFAAEAPTRRAGSASIVPYRVTVVEVAPSTTWALGLGEGARGAGSNPQALLDPLAAGPDEQPGGATRRPRGGA